MCAWGKTLKNAPWGVESAWKERSVTDFLVLDVQLQKNLAHL